MRQVKRGGLRSRVGRYDRQRSEPREGQVVDNGSFGAFQEQQERIGHFEQTKEVDREGLFKRVEIAEVVVEGYAGIIDENVERVDLSDGPLDLGGLVTSSVRGFTRSLGR